MLATRYYGITDVRTEDVPIPQVGAEDVLVRVAYAGICGSDLHVYAKGMFGVVPPMTMGHEFSGSVEAVGDSVTGLHPGDHVIGDPRLGCMACEWCQRGDYHLCADLAFVGEARPGSYAEYVVLPERMLVELPPSMDLQLAALVEPMAVAVHAVDLVASPRMERAGIIGAGPVGLLTLIAARSRHGWDVVVAERVRERWERALSLGASEVTADAASMGERWADVVFEAAGKQAALLGGLRWLKPGASLALVGIHEEPIEFDPTEAVVKEARLVGASAYRRQDLIAAVELLQREANAAARVIGDVIRLERVAESLAASRAGFSAGKILIDCT